tara:strand:- start:42 stop:692 length:651 start_codon:yes stop_codon:yes gene_type:complete
MATVVVNLTDTFDEWRIKTNSVATQSGDLTTLSTTAKGSLVAAINEVFTNDSDDMENVVDDTSPELGGDLDVLTRSIVSSSNRHITITPNGSGKAVITKGRYSGELGDDLVLNSNDITGTGSVNITGILTATSIAGTVVGTTQVAGNNTTLLATTAFVTAAVQSEDTLAEMNDTTMSGLANLDILQYNGSAWVNKTMSAAGVPTSGFTVAMAIALG